MVIPTITSYNIIPQKKSGCTLYHVFIHGCLNRRAASYITPHTAQYPLSGPSLFDKGLNDKLINEYEAP